MPDLKCSFSWLFNQLLPAACPLCSQTFPPGWREPFCTDCLAGFIALPPAHCSRCSLPFLGQKNSSHLCGRCSLTLPAFTRVHCVGLYDLALRKAVHQFKFNQRVALDRPFAKLLTRNIPQAENFDLIVPIPLHRRRLRHRSYNQSLLLAKQLGKLRGLAVDARLLLKRQETLPQQGLSAREREQNLRNGFSLAKPLSGEKILLVDDVMTTGTTATVASKLLLQGGATEVQVAVVGRAPTEPSRLAH